MGRICYNAAMNKSLSDSFGLDGMGDRLLFFPYRNLSATLSLHTALLPEIEPELIREHEALNTAADCLAMCGQPVALAATDIEYFGLRKNAAGDMALHLEYACDDAQGKTCHHFLFLVTSPSGSDDTTCAPSPLAIIHGQLYDVENEKVLVPSLAAFARQTKPDIILSTCHDRENLFMPVALARLGLQRIAHDIPLRNTPLPNLALQAAGFDTKGYIHKGPLQ